MKTPQHRNCILSIPRAFFDINGTESETMNTTARKATKKTFADTTPAAPVPATPATPAGVSLNTEREGKFDFTTAATALPFASPAPRTASRTRFDSDEALVEFIFKHGFNTLKTQKILDSVRAQGFSCSMARANRLLGRDAKGNPIAAPSEKAKV